MCRRFAVFATAPLVFCCLVLVQPSFASPAARLDDLLSRAQASAEELAVSSELAAARRELGATSARLAAGPTLGVEAGPRRTNGSTDGDLAVDIDLPLLGKANGRQEALAALERAAARLPAAARLETRARIAAAFVSAWAAEREALLRGEDVATVERWMQIVQRRLEQGAEAAFEVDLIAFELEQARAARAEAGAARAAAWAELAVWVQPPVAEEEIGEPSPPDLPPPPPELTARFQTGSLAAALGARRDLAVALARFDQGRAQSRWALRSSLAREAEESVARFGLAYRFPLGTERPAAEEALAAEIAAAEREADQRLSELGVRFAAARSRFLTLSSVVPPESSRSPEHTLAALELRLTEGKARPSEALLLRRAVLAAELARIQRRAVLLSASWELATLTAEVLP